MGMNIQKSAGVKADTFILKRNNMDRWIRMDVAMLIILAICTRLVAGIMNVENLDLILCDGMIIFPADERCSGIGEHALDGIPDAVEVYIPANITFVAPGVLEKIGGLMYIEVAPDNPVYESRDGMLYNKGGELISRPNGR